MCSKITWVWWQAIRPLGSSVIKLALFGSIFCVQTLPLERKRHQVFEDERRRCTAVNVWWFLMVPKHACGAPLLKGNDDFWLIYLPSPPLWHYFSSLPLFLFLSFPNAAPMPAQRARAVAPGRVSWQAWSCQNTPPRKWASTPSTCTR